MAQLQPLLCSLTGWAAQGGGGFGMNSVVHPKGAAVGGRRTCFHCSRFSERKTSTAYSTAATLTDLGHHVGDLLRFYNRGENDRTYTKSEYSMTNYVKPIIGCHWV